jgi:hypothetical protein
MVVKRGDRRPMTIRAYVSEVLPDRRLNKRWLPVRSFGVVKS